MKKWEIRETFVSAPGVDPDDEIIRLVLKNRGLTEKHDIDAFLDAKNPKSLTAADVGIDPDSLKTGLARIRKAVHAKESIVVYADYDADGITAGTILWETLFKLGARVMPYIPHRAEEGYGLSIKGIDAIIEQHNPSLVITVDHGITGAEKVAYLKSRGIDVIVSDHHVKPETLPDCTIIHTTSLCGAGVSWFIAKELIKHSAADEALVDEITALAAIGTIADLVPLLGANRSIVKYGLEILNKSRRVGLNALIAQSGLEKGSIDTYSISHVLAPRINAMGRLEHAMDALRLLCTNQEAKAQLLAQKLGTTNRTRQDMTVEMSAHAKQVVETRRNNGENPRLLFVADESYNQGVIGLIAGRLVEEYYLPSIVLSIGETVTKASARSIAGFNVVEAIRQFSDLLVDVGGHPMAAGFTVKTQNVEELSRRLEAFAAQVLTEDLIQRVLSVDVLMDSSFVSVSLWKALKNLAPFGFGNPQPVFASQGLTISDMRRIGKEKNHLKLSFAVPGAQDIDAVAFRFAEIYDDLSAASRVDIAYTVDMNVWNGKSSLQLKIKDIRPSA